MPSATASEASDKSRQHKKTMSSISSTSSAGAQPRGSQSPPAAMNRETTPESLADADQKTKKRIQNRVAQRTYRNRMKQRVQDLEQQLCEMRARQQQQQYYPQDMPGTVTPDGSMGFVPNAGNMPPTLWQQTMTLPRTPGSMSHDMWPGMAVDGTAQAMPETVSMAANPYIARSFHHQPPFNNPALLNQLNPSAATGLEQVPMMSPSLEMPGESSMQRLYRNGSTASTPNQESLQLDAHFGYRGTVTGLGHASEISEEDGNDTKLFTNPTSWENSPAMMSPTSSRTGTVAPQSAISASPWGSIATAATEVSDAGSPHQFSSIEERFEYVLECARRVGFDTFDSMAAQYYGSCFDPCSSLAMDQRLSRNRHLPALLAEIRQKSTQWSVWERRAYQDEALKTAEDICAIECREFRSNQDLCDGNAMNLATIQQKLPNVWTLLSGLASATPLQRQGDRSNLVYNSIKQLCALGDASSHMAVDSQ
ncbi:hypothetical protein ISF_03046 [Cordyceps fumosorosea ARSEF 2679]|uniref:BZIP domain-containing protein n=1 Tax=Cordyceps fumosorosea (strain ARSEF 2679) TaxID=1081104 RepID=A0A168B8Q0_CORFA|nr:hypothetical protein ISF_03046 [Cordyceps fumosorosea ARSEF 2679]OAA69776.1 hypothetical protein ISF_03046 [Cordyceps fumosorosea ARSEF 2679]